MSASGRSKSIEPRASRLSRSRSGELPHVPEVLEERPVALAVGGGRVGLQEPRDLGVRHPLGAADHALDELGADDGAPAVGFQDRRQDEAIHARVQGAEAVREVLREHRDNAPGKVDARTAGAGFVVEGGALA